MMDGFDPETLADPIEELASTGKPDATFVLNGISTELQLAQTTADNVDADLAVSIAGCLQENSECDIECQRCIAGLVSRNLAQNSGIIDKTKNAIDRGVQNELSDAIQVATALGNPITDFVVVNGVPITTDGIPNDIPQSPPINIVASICPEGTTPQTTPDNRVECLDINQATVEPIQTVISTGTNGGITSSGTTTSTSPDGSTEPKSPPAPVPPSSTPTTTPVNTPSQTTTKPIAPSLPPPQPPPSNSVQYGDCPSYDTSGTGGKRLDQILEQLAPDNPLAIAMRNAVQVRASQGIFGNPLVQVSADGTCARIFYDSSCEYDDVCLTPQPPQLCPCPPSTGGTGTVTTVTPAAGTNVCFSDNVREIMTAMEQYSLPAEFFSSAAIGGGLTVAINGLLSAFKDPKGFADGGLLSNGITALAGFLATNITYKYAKESLVASIGPSCNTESSTQAQLAEGFFQFIGTIPGLVPPYVKQTATYQANYLCPYLIPNAAEFNVMWNQGLIDDDQWRFGVRANAICEDWATLTRRASQQLLTPDQLAIAKRRKIITDDDYESLIRRNGIVDQRIKDASFKLTEFVPGPSDLVRFMVRDVFDEDVVTSQQLDSEFEKKFTGRAEEWATDQGMTADQFKYFWRAHWEYPSAGQLYQMLHRLRSDQELPSGLGTAKAVKAEDVLRALQINDQSPEWIRRLIAISFSPLTRVDSRRAFEIGELSADQLEEAYLDLGYSPQNAKILRQFSETTSAPIRAKRLGNASTSEVLKWYRANLIPEDQARELLTSSGIKTELVSKYLETENLRKTLGFRMDSLKALRKRFMTGEFSPGEIAAELIDAGISPDSIGEMIESWTNVRDAKYKAPTVGMLCDWWSRGFITMDQFQKRCQNLGYSLVDAERIVAACQGKLVERKEKEAEKLAKEAEAKQRRIESDRRRMVSDQKKLEKEIQKALADAAPCKPPPKPTCEVNGHS